MLIITGYDLYVIFIVLMTHILEVIKMYWTYVIVALRHKPVLRLLYYSPLKKSVSNKLLEQHNTKKEFNINEHTDIK